MMYDLTMRNKCIIDYVLYKDVLYKDVLRKDVLSKDVYLSSHIKMFIVESLLGVHAFMVSPI